jgi:hypothetical protein
MKNKQKGFLGIAIIIIIALGLISGGIYYSTYRISKINESPTRINEGGSNISTTTSPSQNDTPTYSTTTITVTAYIRSIEENKIVLDYIDLLEGKNAEDAKIADGLCTLKGIEQNSDCFPNGNIYYRNVNPTLRTFTLSPNVKITTAYAFEKNPTGIATISPQELKSEYIDTEMIYIPNRITINEKGEVIVIEQIFRP